MLFTTMGVRNRITTTIERQWLAQIIAGTKKIEYRQIKAYWTKRFAKVSVPFELRLLNGMNPPVPEVTVLIHRITKDRRAGEYPVAHQEGYGVQALGQAAAETQTVIPRCTCQINQFTQTVVAIPASIVINHRAVPFGEIIQKAGRPEGRPNCAISFSFGLRHREQINKTEPAAAWAFGKIDSEVPKSPTSATPNRSRVDMARFCVC
jgi:hypothetical protein